MQISAFVFLIVTLEDCVTKLDHFKMSFCAFGSIQLRMIFYHHIHHLIVYEQRYKPGQLDRFKMSFCATGGIQLLMVFYDHPPYLIVYYQMHKTAFYHILQKLNPNLFTRSSNEQRGFSQLLK